MQIPYSWSVITGSVVGSSHNLKGTPNQDAIGYFCFPGNKPACVLAVSDGHGSPKCSRSHIGSVLAVNSSICAFIAFWQKIVNRDVKNSGVKNVPFTSAVETHIRKDLVEDIVKSWRSAVKKHLLSNPLDEKSSPNNPLVAYGATLTIVFICDEYRIYLKLGDGEILTVENDDRVLRFAFDTESSIGEDTHSLCMKNPIEHFDIQIIGPSKPKMDPPKLMLVCTDGFNNAYRSDTDFEQAASDYCHRLKQAEGQQEVRTNLHSWLEECSQYSGDDVTVGLVFNSNLCSTNFENRQITSSDNGEQKDQSPLSPTEKSTGADIDSSALDISTQGSNEEIKLPSNNSDQTAGVQGSNEDVPHLPSKAVVAAPINSDMETEKIAVDNIEQPLTQSPSPAETLSNETIDTDTDATLNSQSDNAGVPLVSSSPDEISDDKKDSPTSNGNYQTAGDDQCNKETASLHEKTVNSEAINSDLENKGLAFGKTRQPLNPPHSPIETGNKELDETSVCPKEISDDKSANLTSNVPDQTAGDERSQQGGLLSSNETRKQRPVDPGELSSDSEATNDKDSRDKKTNKPNPKKLGLLNKAKNAVGLVNRIGKQKK